MAWFSKAISDEDWVNQVTGNFLFGGLRNITERYDASLKIGPEGDVGEKFMAMTLVSTAFPEILEQFKSVPEPSSDVAKSARKSLLNGVESYIESAREGQAWMARIMEEKFDRKGQHLQDSYEKSGDYGHVCLQSAFEYIDRS